MDGELVTITEEFLRSGMNSGVGICNKQLKILGVPTPPKSGWLKELIGKTITKETAEKFLAAKKKRKEKIGRPLPETTPPDAARQTIAKSLSPKPLLSDKEKEIIIFCVEERLKAARLAQNAVEAMALEAIVEKLKKRD